MPTDLRTDRLHLVDITPQHLDALVELDSDPEVMRYLTGGKPTPRQDYLGDDGLLARMMAYPQPDVGYFAALESGRFVGWFHLRPSVVEPEILEIGYRLRRDVWGRGLATEGARMLCEVAFTRHGVARVDACALRDNLASIAVMRRCGMVWERSFRHPRAPLDCERYVVDESGFRAAVAARDPSSRGDARVAASRGLVSRSRPGGAGSAG